MSVAVDWGHQDLPVPRKRGGRGGNVPNFTEKTRDARIADPTVGHLPLHRTRWGIVYHCAKCGNDCDGAAMMCPEHMVVELRP